MTITPYCAEPIVSLSGYERITTFLASQNKLAIFRGKGGKFHCRNEALWMYCTNVERLEPLIDQDGVTLWATLPGMTRDELFRQCTGSHPFVVEFYDWGAALSRDDMSFNLPLFSDWLGDIRRHLQSDDRA